MQVYSKKKFVHHRQEDLLDSGVGHRFANAQQDNILLSPTYMLTAHSQFCCKLARWIVNPSNASLYNIPGCFELFHKLSDWVWIWKLAQHVVNICVRAHRSHLAVTKKRPIKPITSANLCYGWDGSLNPNILVWSSDLSAWNFIIKYLGYHQVKFREHFKSSTKRAKYRYKMKWKHTWKQVLMCTNLI